MESEKKISITEQDNQTFISYIGIQSYFKKKKPLKDNSPQAIAKRK